jgi:hypothetical protein
MFIIGGIFLPRTSLLCGTGILAGRELYRIGYQSPEGPNSHVREAGAIPLNACELLVSLGVIFMFLKMRTGLFISNRKIV